MEITIEAEWGEYKSESGMLGLAFHTAKQLKHFLETGQSGNVEFTKRDLAGYVEVLKTQSEEKAELFFETKWDARDRGC